MSKRKEIAVSPQEIEEQKHYINELKARISGKVEIPYCHLRLSDECT